MLNPKEERHPDYAFRPWLRRDMMSMLINMLANENRTRKRCNILALGARLLVGEGVHVAVAAADGLSGELVRTGAFAPTNTMVPFWQSNRRQL
jgi:hypothetical protein